MNSKITSIFGLIYALGALLSAFGFPEYGLGLMGFGGTGIGIAARDNNKSSEDVGVKNK